ncbi:ribonuclease H2, subunit C [Cyathus striatus]|nr:ribonuclease H2, subunit C [Cyathus striatus]
MSLKATTITRAPDVEKLQECSPNLMPFHIDYTGTAPISMYMRVDAAKEEVGAPAPAPPAATTSKEEEIAAVDLEEGKELVVKIDNGDMEVDASPVKVAAATTPSTEPTQDAIESSSSTPVASTSSNFASSSTAPNTGSSSSLASKITDTTKRFISTFRGRTIQGLKVDVPEGYTGLVLRGEPDGTVTIQSKKRAAVEKAKPKKAAAKLKGRTTRTSKKAAEVEQAEEVQEEIEEPMAVDEAYHPGQLSEGTPVRELVPSSKFSSFVLWHPDIPVDGGRDEYYRALTEWTKLAQEIHRIDDED